VSRSRVAAVSRYVAEDALELIAVEYEPLPAVVDAARRSSPRPARLRGARHNVMLQRVFTWGEVDAAFATADHVVTSSFRWHRLGANPLETFGVISQWDPRRRSLTCRGSFQSQFHMGSRARGPRAAVAQGAHGEPAARRQLRRQGRGARHRHHGAPVAEERRAPVKWIEDRMEYLAGGASQAWDRHYDAGDRARRERQGHRLQGEAARRPRRHGRGLGRGQRGEALTELHGLLRDSRRRSTTSRSSPTNKLPGSRTAAWARPAQLGARAADGPRGAEARASSPPRSAGRNFIPPEAFPYTIASGNEYDSGDYRAALECALEMADYPGAPRRAGAGCAARASTSAIGVVNTIEPGVFDWNAYAIVGQPGTGVPEGATVGIDLFGKLTIKVGFALEGRASTRSRPRSWPTGSRSTSPDVRVVALDTLSAPPHFGPGGSRLGVALTGAVLGAAGRLTQKADRGRGRALSDDARARRAARRHDRREGLAEAQMPFQQVAQTMLARSDLLPPGVDPNPEATYVWTAPGRTAADDQGRAKSYLTAANACHLVLVEVDVETGKVEILRYWIADDCGTRSTPRTSRA
jgi:CO/xanthine dehydrogenase Mo-binding subunit